MHIHVSWAAVSRCSTAALSANTASPKYTPKVCQANLYQLDNNPSGGGHFCSAACWAPACCRIMQNCLKLQVIHHGATTAAPPACNYCSADHCRLQLTAHPYRQYLLLQVKLQWRCCSAAVQQLSVFMLHTRSCSHSCARWLQTSVVTITTVPVRAVNDISQNFTIFGEGP